MDSRGPQSQFDWVAVVCMWIGAVVLAIRSAGAPLLPGMPHALAANFWNFVPAVLLSIAMAIFIYRHLRPPGTAAPTLGPSEKMADAMAAAKSGSAVGSDILPAQTASAYVALKMSDHTEVQEMRFLGKYADKWIELNLTLFGLDLEGNSIRAHLYKHAGKRRSSAFFVYFDREWEDHLEHLRTGDDLRFLAQIKLQKYGPPQLRNGRPL